MNKSRLVGIIMSIIVSASMGFVSAVLVVNTNPESLNAHSAGYIYASNIVLSLILGVITGLFIPLGKLGEILAGKAKAVPPGIKFILINAIPISVGNTLIISLILSFAGVLTARMKLPDNVLSTLPPFPVMWLGNWIRLLLPTLILSYILSVLLAPLITRLVGFNKPGSPQNRQ